MDFLTSLYPFILDWLDLIVRWFHIIVGIAWIGTSFYFNWLDSRLDRETAEKDLEGELWSVHSGGFYNILKLKGPPKKFPKELHWFKWEAYATWISGFILLILVYYLNAEGLMIDKNINNISPLIAILISIIFLFSSWIIYDRLCKSVLINNTKLFTSICFLIAVFFSYLLSNIYGSRAAYIHVGSALGTIMAANVFRVIIPSQKNMVDAALANEDPDFQKGLDAKTRSIHNNYIHNFEKNWGSVTEQSIGIRVDGGAKAEIRNNAIYQNRDVYHPGWEVLSGMGVYVKSTTGTSVVGNVFYVNFIHSGATTGHANVWAPAQNVVVKYNALSSYHESSLVAGGADNLAFITNTDNNGEHFLTNPAGYMEGKSGKDKGPPEVIYNDHDGSRNDIGPNGGRNYLPNGRTTNKPIPIIFSAAPLSVPVGGIITIESTGATVK
mgnify:CR=1 FL=1